MQDSYRELFLSESQEYLTNINNCLVKLEENPSDKDSINEIFRCVHTLKGMSATMGFDKLSHLAHEMEDLLDELRNLRKKMTSETVDALFQGVDMLEQLFEEIKTNKESVIDIEPVLKNLKRFLVDMPEEAAGAERAAEHAKPAAPVFTPGEHASIGEFKKRFSSVFSISVTLIKDCAMKEARAFLIITSLRRLGEVVCSHPDVSALKEGSFDLSFDVVLATNEQQQVLQQELNTLSDVEHIEVRLIDAEVQPAKDVYIPEEKAGAPRQAAAAPASIKKIQNMRIPVERLDKIMNLMGELAIARIRLLQIVQSYKIETLEEVSFALDRLISALQAEVMQTRLLPVAYILDAFPRVVRDVARKQEKDVEFSISGGDIELDRIVLDEISDPLLHLVRNAVDHGLEKPEARLKAKKPAKGKLFINVSRQKGQIYIEVGDDGKGIDVEAVKRTAVAKGIVSEADAASIDEKKILDLITMPGFSTAKTITDISGRGVGLDVVKSRIEYLGGRVDFETKVDEGSKFILTLPLTLAIIKAMLVSVKHEIYAIPLVNIRETIKIDLREVKVLQSFEVVKVRDEIIPIIRLDKELAIASLPGDKEESRDRMSLVICEFGKKALGLAVSSVLGEQDIAVKPLGSLIKRTKGIAGATILGDGKVALILDIMSLR
ncbi:MAG TPA: chemotaxis protein CheA [Candidatus Omnitrophota bacterium]|nr:chemotaxis protein CheA [Candidatus Omnitrophota bacterium]HQO37971.1 chemotaxis protein CheA [Candidatus Omnitrophota bacterium]HQQ05422.1 chemotaxis protein CheA [Candidatus Omnitrophota bacterium]